MHVALIGSTGLVGQAIAKQIAVTPFASETIDCLDPKAFDLCILATPADVSRRLAPQLTPCTRVIDSSSAFRLDPTVPLIIPEINGDLVTPKTRLIASPNCVATILLMALFPLHKAFGAKRLIGSTYQAASGGGKKLIEQLFADTERALRSKKPTDFGLNLFLHEACDEEESKAALETQKILGCNLPISLTCVRVPTLSSHALSLHITFEERPSVERAAAILNSAPGISVSPVTPKEASGREDVFCSRIRQDPNDPYALELWVIGDQLMKGSSTNVLQILQLLQQQSHPLQDGEKQGARA